MYTFKILCIATKIQVNQQMLLTQEPTFVILMVVTQEPTIRKINATHAFQIMEWFAITYHHHVNLATKPVVLKRINAYLHEDMQQVKLGGMFGHKNTTLYSSFTYHLSPLFLFYPPIKPLISTTLIIHMGLYYHFPNYLFWVF